MKRRILAVLLIMAMVLPVVPTNVFAVYSGTCGENIQWTIDPDAGWKMTISGTGAMTDYTIYDNMTSWRQVNEVEIENGVTHIGNYAFNGFGLKKVIIPDSVTSIGKYAFRGCSSLVEISIPNSVTKIESSAFSGCSSLPNIIVPEGVTSIEGGMFSGCGKLTSVKLPDGVTSIGDGAFSACYNLTDISIPSSVISIGNSAFWQCRSLISISLPSRVTSIGKNVFTYCDSLISIEVDKGNIEYCSMEGLLFSRDKTQLLCCPGGKSNTVTIPSSVVSIEERALCGCSKLSYIRIPSNVTSIGSAAFRDCNNLSSAGPIESGCSIEFGWTNKIPSYAFSSCYNLTSVNIPEGVTEIGASAFEYCFGLTSVSIPNSVATISHSAFNSCTSLTDVYYGGSAADWKDWDHISIYAYNDPLKEAMIHCNSKGLPKYLELTKGIPTGKYGVFVLDSSGEPIKDAEVLWSDGVTDEVELTNENGLALVDRLTIDQPLLEVSCKGYQTYTNRNSNYAKDDKGYEVVVLYTEQEGKLKLKQAKYNGTIDLLTKTKVVNLKNTGNFVGDLTTGDFTIACTAMDASNIKEYQLWQAYTKIASSTDGSFKLNVEDGFSSGGNCFVRVVSNSGSEVDTRINLSFTSNTVNKATGLKLGKSAKISVGDNVPFLGGSTFEIGGLTELPLEFQATEDKIYVGVNANIWPSGTSSAKKKELFEGFKNDLAKVKKANATLGKRNSQLMNSLIKQESDFALPGGKVKVNVVGYAECNWGSTMAAGEIYLLCSATTPTFGFTTWVVVVPVTVQINGTFETQIGAKITYDWESATLNGEIPWNASVTLNAFGGVGVGTVVGVGTYGSARLEAKMKLFCEQFLESLDLTGELGIKAYVGPFEHLKAFAHNTWHLYAANKMSKAAAYAMENQSENIYDQRAYELADLGYLENESEWLGEYGGVSLYSARSSVNELTSLQTSTYRNTRPVIGNANGTPVMVWTRADTTRNTMNSTQLVYSVYFDGVWSEPQAVDSDSVTADGSASIFTAADGTLYVAYQHAETTLSDDCSRADYAAAQGIMLARFDAQSKIFTDITKLSESGLYNHSPSISEVNGVLTTLWVSNSDTGDIFGQNNTNQIVYSQYNGTAWTSPAILASGQNAIVVATVGDMDGKLTAAVITDDDSDLATADDHTLTLYSGTEGTELTSGSVSAVQFAELPGTGSLSLVWSDAEGLYRYSGSSTETVLETDALANGFTVLSDRILFNSGTDDGSELYAIVWQDGWQAPVAVTSQGYYLQSYAATEINEATYLAAVQTDVTITEDAVTDDCTLSWAKLGNTVDLTVAGAYVDYVQASAGDDYNVSVDIINNGDTAVESYTIEVYDGDTKLANVDATEAIPAGGTASQNITLTGLDASSYKKVYTVTVRTDGDSNTENDSANFEVGYADLTVDAELVQVGNSSHAIVTISNHSQIAAGGSLCLIYHGDVRQRIAFDAIPGGDRTILDVLLEPDVIKNADSGVVDFEITSDKEEWNAQNNLSGILLSFPKDLRLLGDLNKDGEVDVFDVLALMEAIATETTALETMDFDESGTVDVFDALWLMEYIAEGT